MYIEDFNKFALNESTGLSEVEIDMSTDSVSSIEDFLQLLQEICEQFKLEIIGFWPIGPGGGNPAVKFRGKYEDIKNMIVSWYMSEDKQEAEDWVKEFVVPFNPAPFKVKSDDRFELSKHRKFIGLDGNPIE